MKDRSETVEMAVIPGTRRVEGPEAGAVVVGLTVDEDEH
jgi:hypothetical protein